MSSQAAPIRVACFTNGCDQYAKVYRLRGNLKCPACGMLRCDEPDIMLQDIADQERYRRSFNDGHTATGRWG